MHNSDNTAQQCGLVGIVGRPNVGKSTLMNKLLGKKISITSRKPQTTRHQILGIDTQDNKQIVYVDTPGLHTNNQRALNRYMNRTAKTMMYDVDVVIFVIEACHWVDQDEHVLTLLTHCTAPVILVLNKVDKIKEKEALLPFMAKMGARRAFDAMVPVSAKQGTALEDLLSRIHEMLPVHPFMFDDDQITDRHERFLAAELVREKLMRQLGQEVPYDLAVDIESFKEDGDLLRIQALIWVERDGQKNIVIGKKGETLKRVGTDARLDMQRLFGCKVFLQLWVKVKRGWSDDERAIRQLGYDD